MKELKIISLIAGLLLSVSSLAAEQLSIDFSYERNVNIGTIQPSIKLAEFGDTRDVSDGTVLTAEYTLNAPLAEIVRDAFAQGFAKGGVELVDDGEDMQVVGTIVSSEAELMDRGGVQNIS